MAITKLATHAIGELVEDGERVLLVFAKGLGEKNGDCLPPVAPVVEEGRVVRDHLRPVARRASLKAKSLLN